MSLIDCPKCGRKVMSVASVCPHCSFSLSEHRVLEAHRSSGTRCSSCHQTIPAGATQCPHCLSARPGRRPLWWAIPATLVVLVAAIALFLGRRERQPRAELAVPVQPDTSLAEQLPDSQPAESIPSTTTPIVAQAPPAPATTPQTVTRWTSTWVNVREDRSPSSQVLRILNPGQRVDVADLQRGWWALYAGGEMIGYVARSTLHDEPPEQWNVEPPPAR